jgi:hypothetical protein
MAGCVERLGPENRAQKDAPGIFFSRKKTGRGRQMKGGSRSTSWKPGQSGNPNGRPKKPATIEARKMLADVKALAKEMGADAIKTLGKIMNNPKTPPAARISAAVAILDRGWGKPRQQIENDRPGDFDGMSLDELRELARAQAEALGLAAN